MEWNVECDAVVEFDGNDLAKAVAGVELGDASIERDAVLEVNNEVTLYQLGEVEELVHLGALDEGTLRTGDAAGALAAEQFCLGDEHESTDLTELALGES